MCERYLLNELWYHTLIYTEHKLKTLFPVQSISTKVQEMQPGLLFNAECQTCLWLMLLTEMFRVSSNPTRNRAPPTKTNKKQKNTVFEADITTFLAVSAATGTMGIVTANMNIGWLYTNVLLCTGVLVMLAPMNIDSPIVLQRPSLKYF